MKKIKFSLYFIFISFFTFITIFITIVQKSYSNLIGPIKQVQSTNTGKNINPNLDLDVINRIEQRTEYNDDSLFQFNPSTPATPSSENNSSAAL